MILPRNHAKNPNSARKLPKNRVHHPLDIDIHCKLAQRIPMEIVLVVFNLVEYLLDSMVSLQCHAKVSIASVTVSITHQEQQGLHVLKVSPWAGRIFLCEL